MIRLAAQLGVLVAVLAAIPACTGLEPAVIGAGATAAQSGATFFARGKFRSFELVRFDDALTAMRDAAGKLSLEAMEDQVRRVSGRVAGGSADADADSTGPDVSGERARMVYRDERGQSLVVVIQKRTATVTMIQIDAGTFGEAGIASLLLSQTLDNLADMGAYVDEWNRADPRRGGAGAPGN